LNPVGEYLRSLNQQIGKSGEVVTLSKHRGCTPQGLSGAASQIIGGPHVLRVLFFGLFANLLVFLQTCGNTPSWVFGNLLEIIPPPPQKNWGGFFLFERGCVPLRLHTLFLILTLKYYENQKENKILLLLSFSYTFIFVCHPLPLHLDLIFFPFFILNPLTFFFFVMFESLIFIYMFFDIINMINNIFIVLKVLILSL
jgi:hypothetical protein